MSVKILFLISRVARIEIKKERTEATGRHSTRANSSIDLHRGVKNGMQIIMEMWQINFYKQDAVWCHQSVCGVINLFSSFCLESCFSYRYLANMYALTLQIKTLLSEMRNSRNIYKYRRLKRMFTE